jgi:hypothetical protein
MWGGGVIQVYISGESESSVLRVLRLQYVHMFQCWHGIGVFTRGQIEMYYRKYYANMAKVGTFRSN